jgi:hypothetical protein
LLPSSVKKLAICKWWYNVLSFGKNREVIEWLPIYYKN